MKTISMGHAQGQSLSLDAAASQDGIQKMRSVADEFCKAFVLGSWHGSHGYANSILRTSPQNY